MNDAERLAAILELHAPCCNYCSTVVTPDHECPAMLKGLRRSDFRFRCAHCLAYACGDADDVPWPCETAVLAGAPGIDTKGTVVGNGR